MAVLLHVLPFKFVDGNVVRIGILLDIPENVDLTTIETELHTQHRPHFLAADLILLRFPPWKMRQPEPLAVERQGVSRIADRFPNAQVRILSSHKYQHLIGDNLSAIYTGKFDFENNKGSFLNELRAQELQYLIERSDAILSADSKYTFRLPSGVFSSHFLRVGNIQTNSHNLDIFFFWMLPYLVDVGGILVDTWSIGSIALNCSRLTDRYDPNNKSLMRVEMRDSYLDGRAETRSELIELIKRVSDDFNSPFLSVFSAMMTSRSLKNFWSALDIENCPSELIRLLVLYRMGDSEINLDGKDVPILCNFKTSQSSDVSNENHAQKAVIEIDRGTYFPVFIKEKEVRLTTDIASKNQEFFRNYGSSNGIRIHADSMVDRQFYRHHGIYIDIQKLLREDCFQRRLRAILTKFHRSPKMVIVPPHDSGKALAKAVADHFQQENGYRPRIVIHLDLGFPPGDGVENHDRQKMAGIHKELKSYANEDTITVLDDVLTTGSRLLSYQKRLRDIEYVGQIQYLVGVQRMPSARAWADLASTLRQNNLGQKHTAEFVESVVLPNWDHDSCPLCVEGRLLSELKKDESVKVSDWSLKRLQLLQRSTNDGLTKDVFFQPPNTPSLRLSINSFFGDADAPQSVVLSSVAAAIQEMREHEDPMKRLESRGFPVRTVFAFEDIFSRYTDGILRASILRSLTSEELQPSAHGKRTLLIERAKMLFNTKEEDEWNIQPEVALAIGLRKVPIESADEGTIQRFKELGLNDLVPIVEAGKS